MDWGYYIRNGFGFFLQLFPCVLLCCLPIPASEWKYKRNHVLGFMTGLTVVGALIFPCAVRILNHVRLEVMGNIYMAAAVCGCVYIFFLGLYTKWYKKILIICVVLYYALTQYMLSNFVLQFLEEDVNDLYTVNVIMVYVITMALLFPLFYRVLCHIHGTAFWDWEDKEVRKSLLVVSGITIAYVVSICLFSTIMFWKGEKDTTFLDIFELIMYLIVGWQFAYLYRLSFWKIAKIGQERMQRQEIEIRNYQYEKINREIEKAKRQRHDLRHHMRVLTALLKEGQVEEAMAHIAKVCEQNEEIELEQFSKNITLNALLGYYVGMAREEGITCQIYADMPEDCADSVDLTIVFGNCLENAIEASRQTEEKYLSVVVGTVGHSMGVQIENSCSPLEDSVLEGGRIQMEKLTSSKNRGGTGLKSVEGILEKYGSGPLNGFYDKKKNRISIQFVWNWGEKRK